MRPFPAKISVRVLELPLLESLLAAETPGLSSEHLFYSGQIDMIMQVNLNPSNNASYVLQSAPGIWPHAALSPFGRNLTVKPARDDEGTSIGEYQRSPEQLDSLLESMRFQSLPSFRMYVGGLPYGMSDTALLRVFSGFGSVHGISIICDLMHGNRSKGFGFVRMYRRSDAEEAMRALSGQQVLETGDYPSDYLDEPLSTSDREAVMTIIETAMKELAKLVCFEPGKLQQLEWRDLERMLAVVLDGIGYAVRLTPPTKDGGKDIVVQFIASRRTQSHYVEVKHWVSGKKVGNDTVREFLFCL